MIKLQIVKNPEKAPYMGARYGQDVEPAGIYVTDYADYPSGIPTGWRLGEIRINNPLYIPVTFDNLNQWKYDLSKKYKAKGKRLTEKLLNAGYDAIITVEPNGSHVEIVLFDDRTLIWTMQESLKKTKIILTENQVNCLMAEDFDK